MIEVNVHLVNEASKSIICSTSFTLSPLESKLSLSAIRTGIIGIFNTHSLSLSDLSLSTSGLSKKSIDQWPKLKSTEDYSSIDKVVTKTSADNLEIFQQYMRTLKNPDSLMFVPCQGADVMCLSLYDNWCCDDDTTTTEDVALALLHRGIKTHAPDSEENSDSVPPTDSLKSKSLLSSPTATATTTTASTTSTNGADTSLGAPIIVDFCLAKGFLMPAPTFRVTIRASRTAKDLGGKSFTMYNIFVKQGSLEWFVEHRYSDFSALHEALCKQSSIETGYISRDQIPRMTTKKILSSKSMNAYTVDKRRIKLGKYMNQLICLEQAMSNHLILSFLGMLNTSRFDAVCAKKGNPRNIIHLSKMRSEAKVGDVILFKCANTMSHLQRTVTRSEFDHVGVVVKSLKTPGQLDILESTGDGVTSFSLTGRLRAYHHHDFVEYMCIRQLKDFNRTPELMKLLNDFVEEVVGLPYGFSASQVFSKKQKSSSSVGSKLTSLLKGGAKRAEELYEKNRNPDKKNDDTKNKAFFCSELVAAILKEMDIIPASLNSEYFWPGCFSKDDEIDTIMKEHNLSSYYDDELVIDCRIVEIAKATVSDMMPKKRSETLDKDIISDTISDTSNASDDHPQPRPISQTEKVNSKNISNAGLEDYQKPQSQLMANSCAQLEGSSSDDEEVEDEEGGDNDDTDAVDDVDDDGGEICAPMTTFAPSLF